MNIQSVLLYVSLAMGSMFFYDRWFAPQDVNLLPLVQGSALLSAEPSQEHLLYIHTPHVRFAVDKTSSQIVAATLLSYFETKEHSHHIDLLSAQPSHPLLVQLGVDQDHAVSWSVGSWGAQGGTLFAHLPNGLVIEKHFSPGPKPYTLNARIRVVNPGQHPINTRFRMAYGAERQQHLQDGLPKPDHFSAGSKEVPNSSWFSFNTFAGLSYHDSEHSYKKISYASLLKAPFRASVHSPWLALQKRYFVTALVPSFDRSYELFADWQQGRTPSERLTQRMQAGFSSTELTLASGESSEQQVLLFAGPEEAQLLKTIAPKLDLTIDFGVFWLLCDALMWLLQFLFGFINNWGLSIVALTFLIRLAFYHSSAKGFRSMQRIKQLAPQVQRLQEQYAGNDAEKNKAVMELYKKEQVNPFSGCLPALMPLPFMMALYYVLLEAIQLRHVSFLWLPDLSSPDPFFVLPVLLGISMFAQQSLTPMDASQKPMMFTMPLIIAYMATQFPSGLALFYLVNTLLGALQQWWFLAHHRP